MDDPLSTTGNHLTREIKAAFCDAMTGQNGQAKIDRVPRIYSAAAGLGSRDVRPGDVIAAFHNMMKPRGQDFFCVGIDHALALKRTEDPDLRPKGGFSMRGHSVGGFGSVTTNKIIATIGGNVFGKDVQAYPKYGSEKKGLPTTYYLTIADSHIMMHSELEHVDLLCINDTTAILSPHTLDGLQPNGVIFMQSPYADPAEVWKRIPAQVQKIIRDRKVRVCYTDMVKIAREVASRADLQMRMQGIVLLGAFLRLTPYAKRKRHDRRPGVRRRGEGAAQVLRQAGRAGGQGQRHLRAARLQRDEGDPGGGDRRMTRVRPARSSPDQVMEQAHGRSDEARTRSGRTGKTFATSCNAGGRGGASVRIEIQAAAG